MKIHVEGYGCSMNLAETEAIKGHLLSNGFSFSGPEHADFIVINTCAVKEQTETKMLSRIRVLFDVAQKNGSQLIVFGCLPKVSPHLVEEISPDIIQIGPDLEKLSSVLGIREEPFSPAVPQVRSNPFVAILPINSGCTNFCTFCGTKLARGNVKSYSPEKLLNRFKESIGEAKEVWLTSQDTGAYGLDINHSLPMLLESFLAVEGDFRIRVGMMNPHHLRRIYGELVPLLKDPRVYSFLHVPVQAGSDRILKLMRRGYTVSQYSELVGSLKKDVHDITIATDVIVGFPGETDDEFAETVNVLNETKPDIVNISRFGARPNTIAFGMQGQLHGRIKKERSRKLTSLARAISFQQNKKMLGKKETIFVSDEGYKSGFLGRTSNYKPVIISEDLRGKFAEVEITGFYPYYLEARVLRVLG